MFEMLAVDLKEDWEVFWWIKGGIKYFMKDKTVLVPKV